MRRVFILVGFAFFLQAAPALSRGDKCIPQIADGSNIRTKIDLANVSPAQQIGNFSLRFFRQDGSPWTISCKVGAVTSSASQLALTLGPREVVRIETSGASSPTTSGYAIIEDNEPANSVYSMDYVLGVSAYYEVTGPSGIIDTVGVPTVQPTALGTFPVEVTGSKGVYTGMAIVNLAGAGNSIRIDLYPSTAGTASSVTLVLDAGRQRAEFLHENLFPALKTQDFKGIAELKASGPVAILTLLQTQTSSGVQYSTLAATDREALRRNTYMYVPEANYSTATSPPMPVDVDNFTVDFYQTSAGDESYSWDLVYRGVDSKTRRLEPVNGAAFAILGIKDDNAIDSVSLTQLKALAYSQTPIDLSDGSTNLQNFFSFAVRTDVGNLAKVRLAGIRQSTGTDGKLYVDLILEVTAYR